MFGYVKPVVGELLVKDYEFYRATYCGVCRSMKRHTGIMSNMTLSYDSAFLALVRMLYIPASDFRARKRRCIAHPLKSRPMLDDNPAIEYTARAFAVLTYYKLLDDIHDEAFLKRSSRAILRPVVASAKRRARLISLSDIVKEKLLAIRELEERGEASVDAPAELFGELLGEIFAHELSRDDREVTYALGYHLGKFIYSADAAEDYDSDRKCGSYNPYVTLYGGKELTDENRASIKCALILECKNIEEAVSRLPFGKRPTIEAIVKNTIYLGLVKRIEFLDPPKHPEKEDK